MSANGSGDDRLARVEQALTGRERFRTVIKALARDDREQAERLLAACPRRVYTMTDVSFTAPGEAAQLVAAIAISEVDKRVALAALARLAADALDDRADERLRAAFQDRAGHERALAAAAWRVFSDICKDEMELDARTVVGASHGPAFAEWHADEFAKLDATEPDERELDHWTRRLSNLWSRVSADV